MPIALLLASGVSTACAVQGRDEPFEPCLEPLGHGLVAGHDPIPEKSGRFLVIAILEIAVGETARDPLLKACFERFDGGDLHDEPHLVCGYEARVRCRNQAKQRIHTDSQAEQIGFLRAVATNQVTVRADHVEGVHALLNGSTGQCAAEAIGRQDSANPEMVCSSLLPHDAPARVGPGLHFGAIWSDHMMTVSTDGRFDGDDTPLGVLPDDAMQMVGAQRRCVR